MRDQGLSPLSDSLTEVFIRLGLADPRLFATVATEWESVAPQPWPKRSRPVLIRGKTLVVEAFSPSTIAFLRYGTTELLAALSEHLGEGVIERVDILPPGRL